MLCIVQSCYHYTSRCRWNTQGHSKGHTRATHGGVSQGRCWHQRCVRQSVVGKWWKLPDSSPDNPINSLRSLSYNTFLPCGIPQAAWQKPSLQHVPHISTKIETQQPDWGPTVTSRHWWWSQHYRQQNNSAGRENSANPQNNVHCLSKLKLVSLRIAYFYAVHIFPALSQQVNKSMTQEICCGYLKLMCEKLMMESYLNAAISELQFEERFNVFLMSSGCAFTQCQLERCSGQ